MSTSPVKFTGTAGRFDVTRREDGKLLGTVEQRSEHYNLARPVTVHFWIATPAGGRTIADGTRSARYGTRVEAALALEVHAQEQEEAPADVQPVVIPCEVCGQPFESGPDAIDVTTCGACDTDDECPECGEPMELADNGSLSCSTCAEAVLTLAARVGDYAHLTHGTRVRHANGDTGTVVGSVSRGSDGDLWVTIAFDGDDTERRHPSTVTPLAEPLGQAPSCTSDSYGDRGRVAVLRSVQQQGRARMAEAVRTLPPAGTPSLC